MLCTSSETVAFNCENITDALDTSGISEYRAVFSMLREYGLKVQQLLCVKILSYGMLTGSGCCAAVAANELPIRGLLNPEELGVNAALMVLNHD